MSSGVRATVAITVGLGVAFFAFAMQPVGWFVGASIGFVYFIWPGLRRWARRLGSPD